MVKRHGSPLNGAHELDGLSHPAICHGKGALAPLRELHVEGENGL